jgi:hypothetical protein
MYFYEKVLWSLRNAVDRVRSLFKSQLASKSSERAS